MDRQDCQFLIDLYEMQSITQVARKYFLTQPALTKRLQRLEEELGCQLLIRHKKGVSFTAAGELTLPYCRSMLHCGEALLGALNSHRGIVGGSLKLLCSHSYSYRQLPQALKLYCQRYPMVNVEISVGRSAPLYQQFLRQENCIAILRGEWAWSGGYVPLHSEPLCLFRSRDRANLPLEECDYISGGSDDHAAVTQMEQWAQEQGLSLHASKLHVNNINCCKELVRQGLGQIYPAQGSDVAPEEEAQGQSEDGAEGNENGKGLRHEAEGDYLHPSSGQKELPCRQIKGRHAADGHRADTHGDKGAQA